MYFLSPSLNNKLKDNFQNLEETSVEARSISKRVKEHQVYLVEEVKDDQEYPVRKVKDDPEYIVQEVKDDQQYAEQEVKHDQHYEEQSNVKKNYVDTIADAVVTFVEVHDNQHQQEEVSIDMVEEQADATTTLIILISCRACMTHIDHDYNAQIVFWLLKIVDQLDKNLGSNLKIIIPQKFKKDNKMKHDQEHDFDHDDEHDCC